MSSHKLSKPFYETFSMQYDCALPNAKFEEVYLHFIKVLPPKLYRMYITLYEPI